MPSAVLTVKLTPLAPAGAVRLTLKLKVDVPLLPSACVTSPMLSVGCTTPPCGVIEKSSTARPSSAPEALLSIQWIKKDAPLGIFRPEIVEEIAVRSAAPLPFFAPVVTVSGVTKLSAATPVYVPVERSVALVLISKLIWSVRAAVPSRHSSPVYATSSAVMVEPVLFVNFAPMSGMSVPLCKPPRARSVLPAAP